jgi:hypothetical protein
MGSNTRLTATTVSNQSRQETIRSMFSRAGTSTGSVIHASRGQLGGDQACQGLFGVVGGGDVGRCHSPAGSR